MWYDGAMATTTKSTRKKPARAASASRASKTKKPTAKAKVVKAAAKGNVKRVLTPLERVRSIHVSLAFMYAAFAILVGVFAKTVAVPITLALQTRDEFASGDSVTLGPAKEVLYNIEPKYVLVASLALGALASILLATKLRNRYESTLNAGISGFRWIALGVTSSLLVTFVNVSAGVQDFATLKLSGVLILITVFFAWLAERDNIASARPKWLAFVFSLFAGALAWLPLVSSFLGTTVFGMERFGWQVYAMAAVTLAGFTGFAINQYLQIKRSNRAFPVVEEAYLRIDMLTKFAVVLIVLLAYK